ncbi:MAG: hypothetical protein RLN72_05125, partial [Henriciella sp.]
MKTVFPSTLILAALISVTGCASQDTQTKLSGEEAAGFDARKQEILGALSAYSGNYDVSPAAMATAVRGKDGKPVGLLAYDSPVDAVKAGDIAAFIAAMKTTAFKNGETGPFEAVIVSIDQAAAGKTDLALQTIETALQSEDMTIMGGFMNAWFLAMDGQYDEAVDAHRAVSSALPGLTGDLSLAALLETVGREQEALAVYSAITPTVIRAPEHEFDPQSLLYGHVKLVIARQAILLRKMGEVEEAKGLYLRLAEAEPEEAVSFAAALEQIETGRGLDSEPLSVEEAFARSLSDYSLALSYQRLIRSAFVGERVRGFDDTKSAFDQLALIIDPANEDLRLAVVGDLYEETFFDAAIHVIETAPEPTAGLKLAAAQSYLRLEKPAKSRAALDQA